MESPGNMPLSLGNVWIGETRPTFVTTTACNNTPYQYPLTVGPMGDVSVHCGSCGSTHGVHQSWCPMPRAWAAEAAAPVAVRFLPISAPSLSDADVERIARRAAEIVVELLRAERDGG